MLLNCATSCNGPRGLPHGLWPSADNASVYVGLENADSVAVIDVATQRVKVQIGSGQGRMLAAPAAAR